MRQIQFETSKVYGLFVKIDDFKEMKRVGMNLAGNFRIQYETTRGTVSTFTVDGIDENYKILGFVSELTDEQKAMVCECYDSAFVGKCFKDYQRDTFPIYFKIDESFASLLTSLNVLLVNPYGDYSVAHKRHIVNGNWQTAQQHVGQWCLLTCDK